ncbi:MAG: ABC transporter substrate-binding protein [Nakamurella sp.]
MPMIRHRRALALVGAAATAALVLSACGSSDTPPAASNTPAPSTAAPTAGSSSSAAPSTSEGSTSSSAGSSSAGSETSSSSGGSGSSSGAAPVESDDATWCDTAKSFGDITGKSISVYSSIVGAEQTGLQKSWADFTDCTGATIAYTGDKNFEKQVVQKAQAGNPSDIAFVPQPGLLASLVATGKVVAPPQQVVDNVTKYWDAGWKANGSVKDTFYAAPLGANIKSLVWYSPKMFAAKGYTVPTTWDDMVALSEKIAADADGVKPWCAGVESGNATGWTATDWLEEVVLRNNGPDVYDQWVKHDVKFSDPMIADSLAKVGAIWKNEKYVNAGIGDVSSIATTNFADAGFPIQSQQCYMMQQASFYASNWKDNPDISENGDIYAFYLPTMSDKFGTPVEVGGEFTTAFATRPEVQAFQFYLSTAHWANNQSKAIASRVSANKGLDVANVQGAINKLSVSILQDPAAVSRFDASDLMPAAVGSGAEWQALTSWLTGTDDATTLQTIDDAWPAS